MLKKHNRIGKILANIGIYLFAIGFALNPTLGVPDIPEPYSSFSVPLIVIGIVLSVTSNFSRKKD
ncbi:hypothetical protein ACFOUV_17135 [Oceanobacillus longus]|uniref:Uncharacterized protein n=1 Tax=Oceanobacillus longus TaxID=930120 RepID=A0ABV8H0Z3_9BACI